jgi:hypothetical protein
MNELQTAVYEMLRMIDVIIPNVPWVLFKKIVMREQHSVHQLRASKNKIMSTFNHAIYNVGSKKPPTEDVCNML